MMGPDDGPSSVTPPGVRIRFDDFDLSDRARAIVRAFDALSEEDRAALAGTGQVESRRALAVLGRIGELSDTEWTALERFIAAVRGVRSIL